MLLILTLFFSSLYFSVSYNIDVHQNDSFCNCFTNLVNKYFSVRSNIVIESSGHTLDCFTTMKTSVTANSILSEELLDIPDSYIITYGNLDEFNVTLKALRASPGFTSQAKCLVIMKTSEELTNVTEYLWNIRLYKAGILVNSGSLVELYELDLKTLKCGTDIKPIKINQCVNGRFKQDLKLFSVEMKSSFNNCPLRVIWTKTPPWVYHVNQTEPGIYIELVNLFGEVSGIDIVYMPETDVYREELGYQYSFDTMMEDLDTDYAEVFVGLVSAAPRSYLESTSIIYDDNLYFIVPKSNMIPYWKTLTKLYSPTNWMIVFVLFVLVCCLFTLLALTTVDEVKFGDFCTNIMYVLSINLNIGISTTPKSPRLRWFLGSILVYSLITAAVIQGKFYSFIRSPLYESPITNLEELVDSDIPIKFSGGLKIIFMFNGPISERVLQRMESLPNMDLLDNSIRAYNENFATIIDRGVLIMHPNIKDKMQIFDLFSFETCFFMQSKHILYEYFDRTLQRIIECGFMEKFISKVKFKYSLKQFIKEEDKVFQISVNHLEGAFFILFLGYVAGFVCFLCENALFQWKKSHLPKNSNRNWVEDV